MESRKTNGRMITASLPELSQSHRTVAVPNQAPQLKAKGFKGTAIPGLKGLYGMLVDKL
jgi:hypothetical protein